MLREQTYINFKTFVVIHYIIFTSYGFLTEIRFFLLSQYFGTLGTLHGHGLTGCSFWTEMNPLDIIQKRNYGLISFIYKRENISDVNSISYVKSKYIIDFYNTNYLIIKSLNY